MSTFTVVSLIFAAAIGGAVVFGVVRAYRTLDNPELVALWWWAAIAVLGLGGFYTGPSYLLLGLAGLSMVGLGLFIGLNVRGVADLLAKRHARFHFGWSSRGYWRSSGFFLVFIGAVWTFALKSAF